MIFFVLFNFVFFSSYYSFCCNVVLGLNTLILTYIVGILFVVFGVFNVFIVSAYLSCDYLILFSKF